MAFSLFPHAPRALALGLLLSLGGCAQFGPTSPPASSVPLPEAWAQAGQLPSATPSTTPSDLAQWWQRLGDAQLNALVQQALQAHSSVRSAVAAVQQARAQADAQNARLWPSINASGSGQRSRSNASTGNSFQVGIDASWELDIFGQQASAVRAAQADVQASEAALVGVRTSLAAETALQYIELRGAQQRLAIAQTNWQAQQQTLQLVQWRVQAGLAQNLTLQQARAAAAQTAAQLPSLQANVQQAIHALGLLVGRTPAALQPQLQAAQPLPQVPAELALAFPADTLRQRPDVLQAQQRVLAAWARLDQAQAQRLPSLRLGGSLGLRALTVSALSGGAATTASLLSSISLPLWDAGALAAQEQAQQAVLLQAQAGYDAAVLTALREVEDALVALQASGERVLRLTDAAMAANQAAQLAQLQYRSGLVDFQTVLDTQRSLLNAQDSLASTQAARLADHVRLYKALGGGWSQTPVT